MLLFITLFDTETHNLNNVEIPLHIICSGNFIELVLFFIFLIKQKTMGNILYIIAVILVIGWLIGFIGFHAGGLIHILLVIAVIAVLLRLIGGNRG